MLEGCALHHCRPRHPGPGARIPGLLGCPGRALLAPAGAPSQVSSSYRLPFIPVPVTLWRRAGLRGTGGEDPSPGTLA